VLYVCDSFDDERAILSDHICTGLQLANFWQDVHRDFVKLGRVYLPEEDRIHFGYTSDDLISMRFNPQFRELIRFEVDRARGFLERGRPLVELVPREVRIDIELFLEGGLAILRKIEAIGYDVWKTRPEVGKREKASLLARALIRKTVARDRNPKVDKPDRPCNGDNGSFAWCRRLALRSARNFYYAFYVLPKPQRRAMNALYAFMRVTDDLADEPGAIEAKREALWNWRRALERALAGDYSHPLHAALHDTIKGYGIPVQYLHDVIDGVEMDLTSVRFATFDDLYPYCYRVASAVGLACIHIWGFRDETAKQYAEAAGIAFQLTNILRDLGEDLVAGRIYLPQEDIDRFGCPPETWRQRGPAFRELMRFEVERARGYYQKAEQVAPLLLPSGRAVFQVMMRIYRGLLEAIAERAYDVFAGRVSLSRWRKVRHLLLAFPVKWGWV
jgi:phytoene synthase